MKHERSFSGFLIIVVLAFVGFLLVFIPPRIIAQYKAIAAAGEFWVWVYFAVVGTGGALLLISTLWILTRLWQRGREKKQHRREHARPPSQLTPEERRAQIKSNLAAVEELRSDSEIAPDVWEEVDSLARRIEDKQTRQKLEIVAFGAISSGKSSLLNALAGRDVFATDAKGGTTIRRNEIPWPGVDRVTLVDTPGLGEIHGGARASEAADAAEDADLVLLVVDGPLRDWEFNLLERLAEMEKRVLICLNKEDWYREQDRRALLEQIAQQTSSLVPRSDIVSVQARPSQRTRVKVLPGGEEVTEAVAVEPDISALAQRMMQLVRRDGSDLLLANLLLQSRGLVEDARKRVEQSLDRRAGELVDRYMWAAGGAAALSPMPMLDLVAGSAITTKMVLELARVYRQQMDLESALNLLGQLGKNLIAILGVSAATPAVVAAVGTMLKTIPGGGTIAGGILQGLVQAVVTRWIGNVFIEYYKNEMQMPEAGLVQTARREWQRVTQLGELRRLVVDARKRLPQEVRGIGATDANKHKED